MKRYLFQISFDGTQYHGWQIQNNAITIQEVIQKCLLTLNEGLSKINIVGCGRTDSGVHAEEFFFHVDLPKINNLSIFKFQLNQMLPFDIAINNCWMVGEDFHARFGAISRTYQYRIIQSKDPFLQSMNTFISHDLDVDVMNCCAEKLTDFKDFTSFSKVHTDVNNFNCEIYGSSWLKKDKQLIFTIKANRFLRNMVRAIVGTMLIAGKKKIDLNRFCEIINEKNRSSAGPSVSAKGLFLTNVEYPSYE